MFGGNIEQPSGKNPFVITSPYRNSIQEANYVERWSLNILSD